MTDKLAAAASLQGDVIDETGGMVVIHPGWGGS